MTNKIRCPKCKAYLIINDDKHYFWIRDEFILVDGRCENCGYEVEAEYPYEQIMKKFDIEKDFEHLEKPLEILLDRVKSTEEETRKRILDCLIKLCQEKAKKSYNDEEVEKYLYKIVYYRQALEGRKYSEAEFYSELGIHYSSLCKYDKAIECYKKALAADPDNGLVRFLLSFLYERTKDFNKAIEHWDIIYKDKCKPTDDYFYLFRKGELLFKKGAYKEATDIFQQVGDDLKEEAKKYMLYAFVRLGDLDKALQVYYEWLRVGLPDEKNKLDFAEPMDFYFFCGVAFVLLKKNIAEAFEYVRKIELDNDDDAGIQFLMEFIRGKIYLEYACCSERETKEKEEILRKADDCFKFVEWLIQTDGSYAFFGHNIGDFFDNNLDVRYIWEPLFDFAHRVLPESHRNRGIIFDELGKPDEALFEYGKAREYKGYELDPDLKDRIEKAELKMLGHRQEKVKFEQKEVSEKKALLESPNYFEIDRDSKNRVLLFLDSYPYKNTFREEIERLTNLVEKLSFDAPYEILIPCRRILADRYLKEIWDNAIKEHPEWKEELKEKINEKDRNKRSFNDKVKFLQDKNIITSYIRNILSFVWHVCSKNRHEVETLRIQDVEVVILATLRFLSWYKEKYTK